MMMSLYTLLYFDLLMTHLKCFGYLWFFPVNCPFCYIPIIILAGQGYIDRAKLDLIN